LLESQGEAARARDLREQSLPGVQRAKLPSIELYHQLGIAEALLNRATPKGVDAALTRARAICETLHLMPPSPGLLRLWLLEARHLALNDSLEEARDRWEAISEEPSGDVIPRLRSEALLRLALMALSQHRADDATEITQRLREPENLSALPPGGESWVDELEKWAPHSDHGASALPVTGSASRPARSEHGEPGRL
jgi:hypothetical protein